MGAQHEILNHEGLVAFEARARRDGPGLDDALLMNGQIGALGALAPAFAVARSWVRAWLAFSMPLGLIWGRPLSPLRRAISSRWAATVRSNSVPLTTSAITNALRSESDRASRSAGNLMPGINQK